MSNFIEAAITSTEMAMIKDYAEKNDLTVSQATKVLILTGLGIAENKDSCSPST